MPGTRLSYRSGLRPICWTTMPSADFCCTFKKNRSFSSRVSTTCKRPPVVGSTAFNAPPPDLAPLALMDMSFAAHRQLAREASYPVLVHRRTLLLHASLRPRLATTPLRFANPSPPSGWIRDSHPQTVEHARYTKTPVERAWKSETRFPLSQPSCCDDV